MKYVQLLYHYQINSLNLFVKDITAFIEIHHCLKAYRKHINWGVGNGTEGSNPPWHNFPISFPDICYQVVTNRKDNGWGAVDGNSAGACNWNKTQVRIYSNDGTVPVNYIAIGK